MNHYKFTLQPYGTGKGTRFTCPNCLVKRQFTRYIDTETGEYLHRTVGSCNRENKCGYHYTPRAYFLDNPDRNKSSAQYGRSNSNTETAPAPSKFTLQKVKWRYTAEEQRKDLISSIPKEKLKATCRLYGKNNFALFLREKFGLKVANRLISQYQLGTSKKWPGATVFWQVDAEGRIRTGKIMLYDRETGKRVKKPYNRIYWVHKALEGDDFTLKQCLFGEHLLKRFPNKPVAIVESEKSAIICSVYLPRYIWLAVGGLSSLTKERCKVLKDRNVTLFPDLGGFEKWTKKAAALESIGLFTVSDLLERISSRDQKEEGLDIADFLLRLPPVR
ncbi:DUF6371 domain-containing protein [Rufibacter roseolus]|uniref:DUF6371 domain-containing protein n=1 Tax=Rufibacter roseolus TaxID=2817375 RepID=UPI001FED64E4|nr:DUF6371 domain-containing protein [Rufibacter roseolus]